MVELMKMMVTSFQRSRARTATLRAPTLQQAAADPHLPGDSWTLPGESGSVSRGVPAPFSWVLVHKVLLCSLRIYFPVQCKLCNQIPLAFKVKFPGHFQSLLQIPRLRNLLWVLELS